MLSCRRGTYSAKGLKQINQDCHVVAVPDFSRLAQRGIIAAVADGISSSQVSQYASELAVNQFVRDYLLTSDVWSVARAAELTLRTINTQLYVKSQHSPYHENPDKGYVCTFSAVILCGEQAVLLHCGDASIFHVRGHDIRACTTEHRQQGEGGKFYLSNALGIRPNLQVDITTVDILPGDTFVLLTDGIAETVSPDVWHELLLQFNNDLDHCAQLIADNALNAGCSDNLTAVLLTVEGVSEVIADRYTSAGFLPFIDPPQPGGMVDQWLVQRQLYNSERSQVYLVTDKESDYQGVLKIPAKSMQDNNGFLDEFAKEEWIAARVNHPNILSGPKSVNVKTGFYIIADYHPGKTLQQWLHDNGNASLEQARDWIKQLVDALTALHRQGILHQDIRPGNLLVDEQGNLTLIDLGSASIANHNFIEADDQLFVPGDLLFSAPEYFVGIWPDERSEQFSVAVLLYFMLTGEYPYNSDVAKQTGYSGLLKLRYTSLLQRNINVPVWLDAALKRACHPQMTKRYPSLSEFIFDIYHPNPAYQGTLPLIERHPVRVWQGISALLTILLVALSIYSFG